MYEGVPACAFLVEMKVLQQASISKRKVEFKDQLQQVCLSEISLNILVPQDRFGKQVAKFYSEMSASLSHSKEKWLQSEEAKHSRRGIL